ncbi:abortive infection family protein [Pseudomonas reactans]
MANNDGLTGLAALSAKVKGERQKLLDHLKAFDKKLVESAGGLGCRGSSKSVTLEHWEIEDIGVSGGSTGWLSFTGERLIVRVERFADGSPEPDWNDYELAEIKPDWVLLLSTPAILESLVADILRNLEEEHITISTTNDWLTDFVSAEKAAIDSDIKKRFEHHPTLLESWQKAQKTVEVDPEDSIARSSSHVETVLKACLKELRDTGYETLPLQNLTSRTTKKLHEAGMLNEGAKQSLAGIGTIFHGIGTLRNSSSTAHGKNDGYTPPGPDLAQLINHLSGACSAFVLKQTAKVFKDEQKQE